MRLTTIIKILTAALIILGVAMWILMPIVPVIGMRAGGLIGGPLLLALHCIPALLCASTYERGRVRALMISGIAASALSALGWVGLIFWHAGMPGLIQELWIRCFSIPTVWAGLMMVLAAVMHHRSPGMHVQLLRVWTMLCASVLGVGVVARVWDQSWFWTTEDGAIRFLMIASVLTVFSGVFTVLIGQLRQLISGRTDEPVVRMALTVWCPRCGLHQPMQTGGTACAGCGLAIRIIVP